MISVQNLNFSYGYSPILEGVYFSVADNLKVGLVGPNGAGKTTLLNLLTKKEFPDSGSIEINGTFGFVPQEVKRDPDLENSTSIKDYLDPSLMHLEIELLDMLKGLELEYLELSQLPQALSGGQKTKLALARALLLEPDILLLDEPTNFLDVSGKKWVMEFLSKYPKTLILISHDLELMNKYIDKVLVINPITKKIDEYKGNYTNYLDQKEERENILKKQVLKQHQKVTQMQEGLKKLSGMTSAKGVRQRVIMQRRVERLKDKLPELPRELKVLKFHPAIPSRVGEIPIKATNISKSYGENLILDKVNLTVVRGERIALIGPNGAGKSTLLKILVGSLEPDSGEIIKDEKLKLGYYSQEFETFDMSKSLLETVKDFYPVGDIEVRKHLGKFLFPGEKVFQSVGSLSGGEKTRLSIAILMIQDFNLLILDEPTTYLDVLSQRVILEALKEYQGTLIIVSHTEEFIKELKPTRGLLLPENLLDIWSDEKFLKFVGVIS